MLLYELTVTNDDTNITNMTNIINITNIPNIPNIKRHDMTQTTRYHKPKQHAIITWCGVIYGYVMLYFMLYFILYVMLIR